MELDGLGEHKGAHDHLWFVHDDQIDRQHAFEFVIAIHDEDLIGVVGQFIEAAQVTRHDL